MKRTRSPDKGSFPLQDDALIAIQSYVEECLFEPAANWPSYWFDRRSYERWAANEIIEAIRMDISKEPIDVVKEFIRTIDDFDCAEPKAKMIFSTAKDVATDILNVLNTAS